MNQKPESPLLVCLGVGAGVIVAIVAFLLVPKFQELYAGFGAPLPMATTLLLATFRWWGMVPIYTLVLWAIWPNPAKRGMAAMIFGLSTAILLLLFGVWAAYAPIFRLGMVVS
jgi:sulfite exporter TauE/SafE